MNAKETVMTVGFRKKIDDAYVKDILSKVTAAQFNDAKQKKALAKDLVTGKQTELSCHLLTCEGKLGRSTVIDVNSPAHMAFRQVDHRTIDSMVFKNTKYTVK